MLDYIKKQISAQQQAQMSMNESKKKITPDSVPDDVILEYAQLYQELDDLSEEGTDSGRERALGIDIPLEDDIEIETVEFNLKDGRVSDVPGDATVTTESYKYAKTYDQFYEEASLGITRLPRESRDCYDARVREVADVMYNEYCTEMTELGLHGFGEMSIDDDRIPSKVNINFGPYMENGDANFIGKVNTYFATNKEHKITKKQFDSFNLVRNGAFKNIGSSLRSYMESEYDISKDASVWDIATPKNIIIPRGNGDSFCVVLEYFNELTGKNEYFGWTKPVNNEINQESFDISKCEKANMESFINETRYENKDNYIQEAAIQRKKSLRKRRPLVRFIQEAIDFGDGGSDLPPESSDAGTDTSNDNNDDTNSSDTVSNTGNTSDAGSSDNNDSNNSDDNNNKETAAVNNVSAEIAENVANQTQNNNQTTDDSSDITFDMDDDIGDANNEPSVDEQLDDLDNNSGDSFDDDISDDSDASDNFDDGEVDINNMTIDDLIEQGSEKLKGMTIQQIKDFISSGSPDAVQEAFIITSKNINKEIDIAIRNCLGVLNDNKIDVNKIIHKFKIQGHRLNRVLSKGAKMSKVYSTDEIESITSLNKSLSNLMVALKKTKDSGNISKIKSAIASFTSECKVVANIVETKLNNPEIKTNGKIQQEGFVQEGLFLSSSNAKKRLSSKIPPVYNDLTDIVKTYEQGKLTKGKLMRMYKPKKTEYQQTTGGYNTDNGSINTTTFNNSFEVDTPQMNNLEALLKIVGKILRKGKVHKAFTSDEMNKIDELGEALDDFIDYLESIVVDTGDSSSIIEQIAKDAKNLVNLLSEIHNFCTGLTPTKMRRYDENNNESNEEIDEKTENIDDMPEFDDIDIDDDSSNDSDNEIDDSNKEEDKDKNNNKDNDEEEEGED